MKLTSNLETAIKHMDFALYERLFKCLSRTDRDCIDWYLLSLAVKADGEQRSLLVSRFEDEELKTLSTEPNLDTAKVRKRATDQRPRIGNLITK